MMSRCIFDVHPELRSEWSDKNKGINPSSVSYGSNRILWWKGICGHVWQASAKDRSGGNGCPYCTGKRVLAGFNDVASKAPELAAEWSEKNILSPNSVTTGSHKKIIWKGICGHEWEAIVKNRVKGSGCPYCASIKVLKGFNDLQTVAPEIAGEWSDRNKISAEEVLPNSNQKVWWRCEEGHEWRTTVAIRMGGSRCPYCSNTKLMKGFNDLETTNPCIAKEWSEKNQDIKASDVKNTNRQVFWWKCNTCSYEWKKSPFSRTHGAGCPVCNGNIVKKGFNDLCTVSPHVGREWHPYKNGLLSPDNIAATSAKIVWWQGTCGHEWRARVKDRVYGEESCLVCRQEFRDKLDLFTTEYYLRQISIPYVENDLEEIGVNLDLYLPDRRVGIIYKNKDNSSLYEERKEFVRKSLCKKAKIRMIYVLGKEVAAEEDVICISKSDNTLEAVEDAVGGVLEIIGAEADVDIMRDKDCVFEKYIARNADVGLLPTF
jgi:DNA-directed RNA polymerase subunit RPC12/RpoP